VNREQFESRVLDLWMTTRIPLTRAHVQYHTGVARRQLNKWLDEMVTDSVLECDVDDDGEMVWRVPGAARPIDGPKSFAELEKLGRIREEARRKLREGRGGGGRGRSRARDEADDTLGLGLALARRASSSVERSGGDGEKRKSLLLSAGLSFFGPLGWLYAGSLREALPAAAIALIVAAIVPTFLLMPVLWLVMPLSALTGLVYAWQYNRHGHRTPLFLDDKKGKPDHER
jgi:hypothetical protein